MEKIKVFISEIVIKMNIESTGIDVENFKNLIAGATTGFAEAENHN